MNSNNFIDPPVADRPVPFWIWNGTIEENEIVRQIREMADKGLGGFCLTTGPGLRTPYLSQMWFDRVQLAIETAKECGLHVWIHDEYRHPGGMGATQVTLNHPQFIARQLTFRETTVQGGQLVDLVLPWAPVLQALAVPVRRDRYLWLEKQDLSAYLGVNHQGHALRDNDSVPAYHPHTYISFHPTRRLYWKAPTGRWRVIVFLQEPSATPAHPGLHLDRFNPESVRAMHQAIQQPYLDRFSDHQSKTLQGILTSETRFSHDRLPWSSILPSYFKSRNGYDLLACLPALITYFGLNTSRIRYDYFQTLSELQHRHNNARCADWCKEHALQYASNTTPLRNAHRSSIPIPGTSSGHEKIDSDRAISYRHSAGFATALSAQTTVGRTLDTGFQNAGWGLTLRDMKVQLDALGVQGTNFFVPHAFCYTLDGLRKHATPPSLFHQNPYWKHFRLLSDYAARLAHLLSQGQQVADIALLDPVTSLWTHLAHPYHNWSYVGYDPDEETLAQNLVADWACITRALHHMQRPFHSLDPAFLARANIVDRQLQVGKARYAVLVIPPITNLERAAFEKLRTFIQTGGLVIALGLLPVEDIQEGASVVEGFSRLTDMEPNRMIRDYTGHESGVHLLRRDNFQFIRTGGTIVENEATTMLERLLDEILPRRVHLLSDGKNADPIQYHHRADEKHQLFFFVNTENAPITTQLNIPASGQIERWDLETGDRAPLAAESTGEMSRFSLHFDRLQSHMIVTDQPQREARPQAPAPELFKLDLRGQWKIDLEEDNALRLDKFKIRPDPENKGIDRGWHQPTYSDSWWAKTRPRPFENPAEKTAYWYRTNFIADIIPSKLSLVMDRSAIQGTYQIYLNGFQLPDNAFRPTFRYDHANATCTLVQRIAKGKNVIAIRLEAARPGDGLVDALYLFGRFQVKSWRGVYRRLALPRETGPLFDFNASGLPFFAGTVAYSQDIVLSTLPQTEHFEIDLDHMMEKRADAVEIKINGQSLGVRAWPPYRWTADTACLKQGKNRVVIRVTNTLEKLLTGMAFQPRTRKMVPVEI